MRLDHLLSKESHRVGGDRPRSLFQCVVLLISDSGSFRGAGWVEHETRQSLSWKVFGTLLGPEETPVVVLLGGRLWSFVSNASRVVGVVVRVGVGVWLCVECCIVDASILL